MGLASGQYLAAKSLPFWRDDEPILWMMWRAFASGRSMTRSATNQEEMTPVETMPHLQVGTGDDMVEFDGITNVSGPVALFGRPYFSQLMDEGVAEM